MQIYTLKTDRFDAVLYSLDEEFFTLSMYSNNIHRQGLVLLSEESNFVQLGLARSWLCAFFWLLFLLGLNLYLYE